MHASPGSAASPSRKPAAARGDRAGKMSNAFVMRALRGDVLAVTADVRNGQNVDALHTDFQKCALHVAADNGDLPMVQALVGFGADVNLPQPTTKDTPLHYSRDARVTIFLLRSGADKRLKNRDGLTPLYVALRDGVTDVAQVLGDPPNSIKGLIGEALSPTEALLRWKSPSSPGLELGCIEIACSASSPLQLGKHVRPPSPDALFRPQEKVVRTLRVGPKELSHTVTGLLPHTTYDFCVRACNASGWSKAALVTVTLPGEVPGAPKGPIAYGRKGNDINIAWSGEGGRDGEGGEGEGEDEGYGAPPPPPALEYAIQVVQESSGSDTDPDMNEKAAAFAKSKGRKPAVQSSKSAGDLATTPASVKLPSVTREGVSLAPASPSAVGLKVDMSGYPSPLPSSPSKRDSRRGKGKEGEDRDIRGLMLGFTSGSGMVYKRPGSSNKHTQHDPLLSASMASAGWATSPTKSTVVAVGPLKGREMGHGMGYGDDVTSPFPLTLPKHGVTVSTRPGSAAGKKTPSSKFGGLTGTLADALTPQAPLAPAVEDVPVTDPAATQNPDEADDERFDAYSSRRRVIRVPPSNLQDVRPPPEAYAEAGMAGDASTPKIGTVVKDVLPGIHGKIQIRARNEFGWGPFSPVATFMLDPAPGTVSVSQTQISLSCAHPDRRKLWLQQQVVASDGPDGCCEGPPWHDELWFSPWLDVYIPESAMQGLVVTVSDLLPGTRYRFRQRSREDVDWDQCPLTLPLRTHSRPPEPVEFLLVTSLVPGEALVGFKCPRANGRYVDRVLIKWTRVRKVSTKDDSDSEGDGQDELAEASFDTVLQVIDAPEDSTAAQKFERETFIWQTVPASRGFDVISRDAMYAEMTRDAKEPVFSTRLAALKLDSTYIHMPRANQLLMTSLPKADSYGLRDSPMRHSVKNLRPGGYYKIGVAAQNGDGWGPFTEWPLPVRIASKVPSQPSKPFAFPLSPTSMAVMFSIPRSHGAAITGYELWRKRCKDKEESTYHDESIAKHLPSSRLEIGWGKAPIPLQVRRAPEATGVYVQPGLPGVKLDLTSPGADIEFDDAERPVVALDYNGRKSHKVLGWPFNSGLDSDTVRLASLCMVPGRPWVQVTVDGLPPGSFHRFKVAALNENGRGECSLAGPVAKMLPGVPEPVEIVEARTGGPASAIVSWLAPHDSGTAIVNYVVQIQHWPRASSGDPDSDEDDAAPASLSSRWEFVDALVTPHLGPLVFMQLPMSTQMSVKGALQVLVGLEEEALKKSGDETDQIIKELVQAPQGSKSRVTILDDSDNDPSPRPDPTAGPDTRVISVGGRKVNSLVVPGIIPGHAYAFRVSAYNAVGCSPDGFPAMMKRQAACPTRPDAPVALAVTPRQLLVHFCAPHSNGSAITRFILEKLEVDIPPTDDDAERSPGSDAPPPRFDNWVRIPLPDDIANGVGLIGVERLDPAELEASSTANTAGSPASSRGPSVDEIAVLRGEVAAPVWTAASHYNGRRYAAIVVPDLLPTTRHSFRVTAVNAIGPSLCSDASAPVAVLGDVPEIPEITFLHAFPPSRALIEWRVLRDNGSAISAFDVQYRFVMYKPATATTETRKIISDWQDGGTGLDPATLSMIPEQVESIPRCWPAESVSRWAVIVPALPPKERVSFRVRAWNGIGVSGWSKPSERIMPNVKPPGPLTVPKVTRHPYIEMSHVLCFMNKELNGARIDSYHIQVKDDVEMWKQNGKRNKLVYTDWTDCGFRTSAEVAYNGEIDRIAPDSDDEASEPAAASSEGGDPFGIENEATRRVKYPCCKGSLDHRHAVVTLAEPPNRTWVLYRIRPHNSAGWGPWVEIRAGVGLP